jgi:hypothetical protein
VLEYGYWLWDNSMNANANTPNTPAPVSTRTVIESNHMVGRWIDRLYQTGVTESLELINKDSTRYKGKIHRRRLTVAGLDGQNFFAVAYESADGRWFDNAGMPIKKPNQIIKENDEESSVKDSLSL